MFNNDYDGQAPTDPTAPTDPAAAQKRYNTTANWQDPFNPPSPNDPYWAEWIAANPGYTPPAGTGWPTPPVTPQDPGAPPPPGPPNPNAGLLTKPFTGTFNPPAQQATPTLGGSVTTIPGAPAFPTIPRFAGPTLDQAMNDPGYQFTLKQGQDQLQNWQAAHGTFNDSSAAKALQDYGQNAASTQYQNVWNRQYQGYQSDVNTQYLDPFAAQYQNWMQGTVNPTMTNFNTTYQGTQHANDINWQHSWDEFLNSWNQFKDQRDSSFDKQFKTATA